MFITTDKKTYKAGDVIFKEGTHGVAVYVLNSGKVEISKTVGDKKIVIEILKPGAVFGEMSFIDNAPRSATAIALEETVAELIDKDFLDREFNQIASDFRQIIIALVRRLRKTTRDFAAIPGRKEERISAKVRISFKKVNDFFKAYIANLGSGGLFINTEKCLPVGSLLNLEFNLPNSDKIIQTQGKV
ncbi:MAG TPA: cyclic nucleotide-binding domain-containing protein, partial [Desulfatiglandales bacterium]|nr:cyclic nucleotide-binding domain-containing protein [Desulfatiglandales bacterium]